MISLGIAGIVALSLLLTGCTSELEIDLLEDKLLEAETQNVIITEGVEQFYNEFNSFKMDTEDDIAIINDNLEQCGCRFW